MRTFPPMDEQAVGPAVEHAMEANGDRCRLRRRKGLAKAAVWAALPGSHDSEVVPPLLVSQV